VPHFQIVAAMSHVQIDILGYVLRIVKKIVAATQLVVTQKYFTSINLVATQKIFHDMKL
jgi:hypothetical protein